MEKIKATPKNTELRGGGNVFLMTSSEPLDPVMPEVTFTSKLDQLPFFSVNWAPKFLSFASECFLPPFPQQKSNAIIIFTIPFIITIISLILWQDEISSQTWQNNNLPGSWHWPRIHCCSYGDTNVYRDVPHTISKGCLVIWLKEICLISSDNPSARTKANHPWPKNLPLSLSLTTVSH